MPPEKGEPESTPLAPAEALDWQARWARDNGADCVFSWSGDAGERSLWLQCDVDYENGGFAPHEAVKARVAELPPLPGTFATGEPGVVLAELEAALAARHRAHPLACQLPGAVELVERALAAGAPPFEVGRVAGRWQCPGGLGRAVGALLRDGFASAEQRNSIQHLAFSSRVLSLSSLSKYGPRDFRPGSPDASLAEGFTLPSQAMAWDILRANGTGAAPLGAFDAGVVSYLRALQPLFDHALGRLSRGLAKPGVTTLPRAVLSPDEAHAVLVKAHAERAGLLSMSWELRLLAGRPWDESGPWFAGMLSGEPPAPIPDGERQRYRRGSGMYGIVLPWLDLVSTLGMDVPEELAAQAERTQRNQAQPAVGPQQPRKPAPMGGGWWWRYSPGTNLVDFALWVLAIAAFIGGLLLTGSQRGR